MPHGARPLRSVRRLANLTSDLPKWYKVIKNTAGPTKISIFDEIGFYGVPAASFLDELGDVAGDIELHMHSPGGDIYEGLAIYGGLLQARQRGNVSIVIDGLAASAASFIAMAATPGRLEISPHARMMVHDGFTMGIGNAADLHELADQLDEESQNIAGIYADRTGKPVDYWRGKMRAETWYTDQAAVDEGLADRIHGQAQADPADDWDMSVFASYATGLANGTVDHWNRPVVRNTATITAAAAAPAEGDEDDADKCPTCKGTKKIRDGHVTCPDCKGTGKAPPDAGDQAAAARAGHCPACQVTAPDLLSRFCGHCGGRLSMADASGWVQDPNGSWRFDPDGDGDDDSRPETDTDHDYWTADGQPVPGKTIPPRPDAAADFLGRQLLNADVDNSPWDASKAWANGAASDDPAAFYKGICAGRKAGDPSTQAAWALPYKYHPGDAPNAAGVRNALARIGQTQGLTNKGEAQALLERLMKQVNPDYDAGDLAETGLLSAALLAGLERG
jgi:ATP-dependent protease ClpP protease subunit